MILKPKTKKVMRDTFSGSYFRIPFGEVATVVPQKEMPYRANIAKQGSSRGARLLNLQIQEK